MNGIWIRSQNKGLYLCIGFDAPQLKNYALDKSKPYVIAGYVSDEMHPFLGWYSTEERALQVLDEIQAFINCDGEMNGNKYRAYEMPQE